MEVYENFFFIYILNGLGKSVIFEISRSERIPHAGSLVVVVKLWFSVLLKLRSHIITHPRVTNDGASSNL